MQDAFASLMTRRVWLVAHDHLHDEYLIAGTQQVAIRPSPRTLYEKVRMMSPEAESALLLASPFARTPLKLELSARLVSAPYAAMTLALLVGSLLGTWAALRQNRWQDYSVMTVAMIGITIPSFVSAPILTLLLGVYGIHIFGHDFSLPVSGWGGGALRNMILPVTVLALLQIAVIARLVRGSMVEVLHANYIRTAKAKGAPTHLIMLRHALRAAILPLVSYLAPATAALLTGSLIVEQIFGLPGIGRYFVQGALNRDYTLVMGVTILSAALMIFMNLMVDMIYGLLDPKVRYD
jgi:oligopeptide transport system permease protein